MKIPVQIWSIVMWEKHQNTCQNNDNQPPETEIKTTLRSSCMLNIDYVCLSNLECPKELRCAESTIDRITTQTFGPFSETECESRFSDRHVKLQEEERSLVCTLTWREARETLPVNNHPSPEHFAMFNKILRECIGRHVTICRGPKGREEI
jgi:hypothetical protein